MTRHVPETLASQDWDALIMHYLGLDHIGHKTGPEGPYMPAKQREMDSIVRQIYEAMETQPHLQDAILVLAGDHGMNSGGNHGGSAPGETSTAMLFASPKLRATAGRREALVAPALPRDSTDFDYYRKIEQSDLVPTISALFGVPIPRNNLGVMIPELLDIWANDTERTIDNPHTQLLYRNALQVLEVVKATYGEVAFVNVAGRTMRTHACPKRYVGKQRLSCLWERAQRLLLMSNVDERFTVDEQVDALRIVRHVQEPPWRTSVHMRKKS